MMISFDSNADIILLQEDLPEFEAVHVDGKYHMCLLPVVISYGNQEKFIALPRLENLGREQAKAV